MTRPLALAALVVACAAAPVQAQTGADRAAVRQAVLDYAHALYRSDPALVDRSVAADLVKAGVYGGDDSLGRVPMTFDELRALAASWNEGGTRADPDSALARVTVLDVLDRAASARLDAVWGADYVHLAREPDGAWRIVHVLWQPLPDGPRAAAGLPTSVRYALTPASKDTLTTAAFDALADKSAFSGVVADRWPDGRLKLLRSVVGGRSAGLWTEWYPSGVVRYLGQWLPNEGGGAAVGEGVWVYFHENGVVRYRETYRADRADGVSEGWHANGRRAFEGEHRDGERVGRWRWWNEGGGLDSARVYPRPTATDSSATGWRPDRDPRGRRVRTPAPHVATIGTGRGLRPPPRRRRVRPGSPGRSQGPGGTLWLDPSRVPPAWDVPLAAG